VTRIGHSSLVRSIIGVATVVSVGVVIGLGVRASGVRPVRITSGSMTPTIAVDDWLLITDARCLGRDDIVEFRFPSGSTQRAVKRIVAVGGDEVELTDDALTVNNTRRQITGETGHFEHTTIAIPAGFYYLLGDQHAGSIDSRSFGPVPASDIVGCVRTTIPDPRLVVAALAGLAGAVLIVLRHVSRRTAIARVDNSVLSTKAGWVSAQGAELVVTCEARRQSSR
jgi:signal peptidase I